MNDNVKKYLIKIIIRFLKENKLYKPSYIRLNINSIEDVFNFKNISLDQNVLIDIESLLLLTTTAMYEINTLHKMNLRTNEIVRKYYDFIFNIIGNEYRKENIFMTFLNSNKKICNVFFNNISNQSWEFVNKMKKNANLPTNMEYLILLNLMVNEERWNADIRYYANKIFTSINEKWKTYYKSYVNNIQIKQNNI